MYLDARVSQLCDVCTETSAVEQVSSPIGNAFESSAGRLGNDTLNRVVSDLKQIREEAIMALTSPTIPVTVHRPSIQLPEHIIPQEDIIAALRDHFTDAPDLERGLELMRHAGVTTRRFVVPLERLLATEPFGVRNGRYSREAVRLGTLAARQALTDARIDAHEVDYLVVVSCTGYMLPGPDAYIAQELGCRPNIRRTPIQQLGCAGGAAARGIVKSCG